MQIGIVMLGVSDIERSVAFYRDKVGLEVRDQIPGFAFLNAGQITLALSSELPKHSGGALAGATEIVFTENGNGSHERTR